MFRTINGLCLYIFAVYLIYISTCNYLENSTVIHEWVTVDFDWNDNSTKQAFIENGSFIVENNLITGIKLFEDRIFVSVPRWRRGVPSTLNEIIQINNKSVLRPYPSWQMQNINDCNALQYVQSMEINPNGKMWIIDTGRKYFLDSNSSYIDNTCPPKIVIWDIQNNKLEHSYTFPNHIAQYNNSFLNDIVLDFPNQIAYISDVFGGPPFDGGIIVYDYAKDKSHRFANRTMQYDKDNNNTSNGLWVNIGDYSMKTMTSEDGIALSPDLNYIYYCPMSSYRIYRVPTSVVRNYDDDKDGDIEFLGYRHSQMDGMTFSNESILYFGSMHDYSIYSMEYEFEIGNGNRKNYTKINAQRLAKDNVTIQWPDTFAWGDDDGYLYFTTNKLHRYFMNNMDWTGKEGANMRIHKIFVGASSYMNYHTNYDGHTGKMHAVGWIIVGVIVGVILIGTVILAIYHFRTRRKATFGGSLGGFFPLAGDDQNESQDHTVN